MTPDRSESSEELPNSEESHSAAPSSSTSVQIRVKNVSEINSNEAEAEPSPPTKRKLPSWMSLSSHTQDNDSNKKRKTEPRRVQCASAGSTVEQPESSITPSTSRNEVGEDLEQTTSSAANGEISVENGDVNGEREVDDIDETNQNGEIDANGEAGEEAEADVCGEAEVKQEVEASVEPPGSPSTGPSTSGGHSSNCSQSTVKAEPDESGAVGLIIPASPRTIKPATKVEKEEATSSTMRLSCKFGIRCYRQNPIHRREEAHPGDKDYRRPSFPTPPDGTPDCPFGDLCYRRNPVHFQQYSHPPSTDFKQNWKNHKMRLRQRQQSAINPNSSYSDLDDEDDYDLEDPFIDDDSDDEFIPNDDEEDDDDFL